MNREAFLKERMTGVGGSDSPALLGLSSFKTALDVYLQKRGEDAFNETPATRWGNLLEPVVRQEYAERTGRTVTLPAAMLRHEKYPFVIGHPDGIAERRLYEGKIARSSEGWGEPGTDQIPEAYVIQVQHYMAITALPVADVAVLIGNMDFRMYEIPADVELQEMIIDAAADFWKKVEAGTPPDPDWDSPHTLPALRRLYPGTNGTAMQAEEADVAWRRVMEESTRLSTTYDAQAATAKAHLLWRMGESALMKFGDGKVFRRKEVKRKGYTVEDTTFIDARLVNAKE